MAFTTLAQINALKDSDLLVIVSARLGYWDVGSLTGGDWSIAHTVGAIYRDRIEYWWILDIDGVRDARVVYCDAGLHAGQIVPMSDVISEALADATLLGPYDTWQQAFRDCITAWSGVSC